MSDKVQENKLRRMAKRQGLELVKSRRRDPRALDYGGYWLVREGHDYNRPDVVVGGQHGCDLATIERSLTQ